uniref:AGBL carboxypeptidase 4 n=1 Tax=Sphenodon punctatus TaxID=8508 RepID=A0A8D0GWM9_SPHPU
MNNFNKKIGFNINGHWCSAFGTRYQKKSFLCFFLPTANLQPGAEQKVVFITARVHPGETPSSFVCQGIIDFLVSSHPVAKVLRDHLVFKIVPMLNPDGVYLGNYRCSLMGFDLNRHWVDPSPWAHPTLHGIKQLIVQMYNNQKISLEFYIDIHAHSTMMNGFMYGNIFEEEERFQRQAIFPKLLCQNAEDFSFVRNSSLTLCSFLFSYYDIINIWINVSLYILFIVKKFKL